MLPHWTENDLLVDGVRLHYTRTGDGNKPPLVLAHGFSDSGPNWLQLAKELEADFDIIFPDARGHGKSARVQPGEAIDMVTDLAGLIQGLGLTRPVLGGHSMGANVSSQVAACYPDLLRALILEDPAWLVRQPEVKKEEQPVAHPYETWLASLDGVSLEDVMAKCRAECPTWGEIELLPWAISKKQFDPNFIKAQSRVHMEWPEVVQAIRCPTLLIVAEPERGAIVTADTARMVTETNPYFEVVNVSGAGHNVRRENFGAVLVAVKEFLRKVK